MALKFPHQFIKINIKYKEIFNRNINLQTQQYLQLKLPTILPVLLFYSKLFKRLYKTLHDSCFGRYLIPL